CQERQHDRLRRRQEAPRSDWWPFRWTRERHGTARILAPTRTPGWARVALVLCRAGPVALGYRLARRVVLGRGARIAVVAAGHEFAAPRPEMRTPPATPRASRRPGQFTD